MEEINEFAIEDTDLKHQFGMLIVGTVVGFVATKGTHKAYRMAVEAYRAHKALNTVES
jgi:hypothetical protein